MYIYDDRFSHLQNKSEAASEDATVPASLERLMAAYRLAVRHVRPLSGLCKPFAAGF